MQTDCRKAHSQASPMSFLVLSLKGLFSPGGSCVNSIVHHYPSRSGCSMCIYTAIIGKKTADKHKEIYGNGCCLFVCGIGSESGGWRKSVRHEQAKNVLFFLCCAHLIFTIAGKQKVSEVTDSTLKRLQQSKNNSRDQPNRNKTTKPLFFPYGPFWNENVCLSGGGRIFSFPFRMNRRFLSSFYLH